MASNGIPGDRLLIEESLARSWLYVPAHKERMIARSLGLPADVVIYDYEDAVPPAQKIGAREVLANALPYEIPEHSPRRYVRVNHPRHTDLFRGDVRAALALNVEGIVVPKVEDSSQVRYVSEVLAYEEKTLGLVAGSVRMALLIESPLGVINAYDIIASDGRTIAAQFGGEDFSREMGLPLVRSGEAKELLYQRSAVATACAAAGAQAIDVIWTALEDLSGLTEEAAQARRLGYTAKAAIHPSQIDPINAAFSPTDQEIDYAREVIAALDAAVAEGTGVINLEGAFIEEPVVARARRTLDLARRYGEV